MKLEVEMKIGEEGDGGWTETVDGGARDWQSMGGVTREERKEGERQSG